MIIEFPKIPIKACFPVIMISKYSSPKSFSTLIVNCRHPLSQKTYKNFTADLEVKIGQHHIVKYHFVSPVPSPTQYVPLFHPERGCL